MDNKRTASEAIMDFLEWTDTSDPTKTEYEKGIIFGLNIAQQLACEVENAAVDD